MYIKYNKMSTKFSINYAQFLYKKLLTMWAKYAIYEEY